MLNIAVSGHTPTSLYYAAKTLSDLWHDQDFVNLRDIPPLSRPPSSDSLSSMADKPKQGSPEKNLKTDADCVKLAARLVSTTREVGMFHPYHSLPDLIPEWQINQNRDCQIKT